MVFNYLPIKDLKKGHYSEDKIKSEIIKHPARDVSYIPLRG